MIYSILLMSTQTELTQEEKKRIIKVLDDAHKSIQSLEQDLNRARDYFRTDDPKAELEDDDNRGDCRVVVSKNKDGHRKYRPLPTEKQAREKLYTPELSEVFDTLQNLLSDFKKYPNQIREYKQPEHWYGKTIWDIDTETIEEILTNHEDDV